MNAPYHNKALPEGTVLREWRLEQVLGVGGFGIVYRGRGVYFDELVAIKEYFPGAISDRQDGSTVTPTDSSSEEIYAFGLAKFVDEAKILWNLSRPERHPNIVNVRSLFEVHGTAYMVMDFEQGASLSQMLREGRRFTEAELMAMMRPIAEGLDRAHRAGVVHRDIKPANILVADDGRPVLIDFGSARFEAGQTTSTKVTFYTPPYAALEQYVKTYPQGAWTDIYALGVTLYQCITGEKPAEVLERMHGGADEPLAARELPGFSRAFTRAVDAAMAIRPADRPQSITQWLRLFELPDDDGPDDAPSSAEAPPAVDPELTIWAKPSALAAEVEPPPPVRAEPAPPPVRAEPVAAVEPPSPRKRPSWLAPVAGGGVLVVVGGVAAAVLMMSGHRAAPVAPPVAPASAPPVAVAAATSAGSAAAGDAAAIAQAAAGLLADARTLNRAPREIAALTAAQGDVAALADQIRAAGSGQDAAAKIKPLAESLRTRATGMAQAEAAALSRGVLAQWREADHALAGADAAGAGSALDSLRRAKASLDADASQAKGADPAAAIAAAHRALTDYTAFASAYTAATPYFLAAKTARLQTLASQARAYEAQVVSLAAGPAPWLFAPEARKRAYKDLQSNANRAKSEAAQLDQVVAAADGPGMDAAMARVTSIKSDLAALYASSLAAHSAGGGQQGATAPSR